MQFGDYQLIKRIASGGMAEIFVGRVRGLGGVEKIVVIKRILPQLSGHADLVQMFIDEARIIATLQHANVVQMHEVGEVDGRPFIAMEYLHGEDVRTLMSTIAKQGGDLPLEHALSIIIGMCAGLHYAHEKRGTHGEPLGIVHRDISPHNVVVTYDGTVKVVDFGIAMAENREHQTESHVRKGKVQYMSPEQVRCKPLDRRSDVFAVGIMLYELTCGRRLFKGKNEYEVTAHIDSGVIPKPSARDPEYPAELERIVLRSLETDPSARYQSCRELQADLEAFAHEQRLQLSSMQLSDFMGQVFGQRVEAWRDMQTGLHDLDGFLRERHASASDVDDEVTLQSGRRTSVYEDGTAATKDLGPTPTPTLTSPAIGQIERGDRTSTRVRRSRAVVGILGVLALGAAGVAGYLISSQDKEPARAAAPAPSPSVDAPPPRAVVTPLAVPIDAGPAAVDKPAPREKPSVARSTRSVAKKRTKRAHKKPEPKPKPEPKVKLTGMGELRVASKPSCEVIIGGRSRGHTSLSVKLPAGAHELRLRNTEYGIDARYRITIAPGKITKKRYTFKATSP